MEEKNFETARSLAERIYSDLINRYDAEDTTYAEDVAAIESLLEPHIRKPSDDDKPLFNLEADIEWLVRGCMRIMHNKKDGDGKAYRELKEFVSQKVRPIGPETKSVPERCEEAYNEALNLLSRAADLFDSMGSKRVNQWMKERKDFLNNPNPFKEADIVNEDEPKPTRLPFSLEEAKNGAKVVTRDMYDVKIVEDNIFGLYPVLSVGTQGDGSKFYNLTRRNGESKHGTNNDLFILKESEKIDVHIAKDHRGFITAFGGNEPYRHSMLPEGWELIKTITVEI